MARVQGAIEQLIRMRVKQHPHETWLKFKDQEFSWEQVLSNIHRAANGLLALGIAPGDRVAIMMGNRPEFLWIHFAIGFIGAVSVPVNTSQRGVTLHHVLADSDSAAVIFEELLRDSVMAVKDSLPSLKATVVADGKPGNGVDSTLDALHGASRSRARRRCRLRRRWRKHDVHLGHHRASQRRHRQRRG